VDDVAERAGVAKTTVYRRWPTKDHLAIAVGAQMLGEVPIPDTGNLRRDLTGFAGALADSLSRLRMAGHYGGGASPGLAAELVAAAARHPDIGEAVRAGYAQRHALARARLERAVEREGLRSDLDPALLIEQLVGPIYYRILITGAPADRGYAERLVDALLDGAFVTEE
jgi:AcrR family transcriptional regulator